MQAHDTFTGRSRRRSTTRWVRFGDRLARVLITAGGIGTIAAVLLMGLFLLTVALPLFAGGRTGRPRVLPLVVERGPTVLGAEDNGMVGWWLDAGTGSLVCFETGGGAVIGERSLADGWLAGCSSIRLLPGRFDTVVGYDDGSFRLARIGVESSFIGREDLPTGAAGLAPGETYVDADTTVVCTGSEQWARVEVIAEPVGDAAPPLPAGIVDVDVAQGARGPIVAALAADGTVRVETTSTRRNLLTDELVVSRAGATIAPAADGFRPAFVRVSELGDQLFLLARDGSGRRYSVRDIEAPEECESFKATPAGAEIAAVIRLFGGGSLAVGDSIGGVGVVFTVRSPGATAADGLVTTVARYLPAATPGEPVVTLAASPRSRLFAVADAAGRVRLLQSTSGATVLEVPHAGPPPDALAIGPREQVLLAAGRRGVWSCGFDSGFPEVSPRSLFAPVWYENYPAAVHAWETTGHESFEPKYGFLPLVLGTLKSTLYSMLFATPVAILAALYASQFMHPRWKARIKPTIEMMASLPSVVLGFVAGLVFAPLVEGWLPTVIAGLFMIPLTLLFGAHLWQLLPAGSRVRGAGWRFPLIAVVGLPLGCLVAWAVAPWMERFLFGGDLRRWLDGGDGSGLGGWVLALLPLAGIVATMVMGRLVNPVLRRLGARWSPQRAALVSLATFLASVAVAVLLALAAGMFLDALRFDARGGILGSYVQRNALVVAFGMSFAIIPLVFTIADDALSSVPDHLRSASLGAGATLWQTAVRVIMPAAASGLFSAVMIGLGRAVGETMIVLMAAGNTPIVDWNLFTGFQTLSAAIATDLPEAARGSAHYRVLFLAAVTLFAITFVVNTAAEVVRQRFRRRAHDL
jgi:phosphate transport system permease protein